MLVEHVESVDQIEASLDGGLADVRQQESRFRMALAGALDGGGRDVDPGEWAPRAR
jgi:hypothetical protein